MELKLYDTLTREKRPFVPLDPARVRMYVCGPTVYDFAHIGNARPVIVFDVLFRLLRHLAKQGVWDGGKGETTVTYARNITDVDDKINARAAEEYPNLPLNEAIRLVTTKTEAQFHDDIRALGVLMPEDVNKSGQPPAFIEPRATEHIEEMKTLIERLVAAGKAYVAEDHVLFSVPSMPDYGKLSKRSLDEMEAGARVEVAPYKTDSKDFVLWKPSKPGEPSWPSPSDIAAPGRPGWHIECSAMSWKHLGETFDIHGGGIDLVFPHHENEIAQSRCSFHTPVMANYWMHNGFLQVEGEKMSKSLGNFVTIRELLEKWTGSVVRYTMMQTHYNQPIDWTVERLERSRIELGNWAALYSGSEAHNDYQYRKHRKIPTKPSLELVEALADNLNTPQAIAVLREQFSSRSPMEGLGKEFFQNCEFLGLVDPEKMGSLEAENVSGSVTPRLLFDSFPIVYRLRAGIANSREDIIECATHELRDMGIVPTIRREGFVDLQPLTKEAEIDITTIEKLVADRLDARTAKNFKEADRIRDELKAMDIELEDKPDGTTTWKVKR